MAHITSQSAAQGESQHTSVPCEDIEDSDSSKEGTNPVSVGSDSVSSATMSPNSFVGEENDPPEEPAISAQVFCGDMSVAGAGDHHGCLEDTSCSVKKKNNKSSRDKRSGSKVTRTTSTIRRRRRSECRGTIKAGAHEDSAVSCVLAEQEEGCAKLNLATTMERVNSDLFAYGRSGSPYLSSENEWEASDHSDTDADHSDSSDDDNPTSQVDRLIERGARLIMDGENSNLSSETDDTDDDFDDDSDSDITDVSPLVSNAASPLGLSPVMSRRNLPSSISSKPPFMRHYSHKGHEGDVEDEIEDEHRATIKSWTTDDIYSQHDNAHLAANSPNMSLVVQALLNLGLGAANNLNTNDLLDNVEHNIDNQSQQGFVSSRSSKQYQHHLSPALHVNPHHRHLRKTNNSRRKNMSFTNDEARIIDRDNSIILEKLLSVGNREDKEHNNPSARLQPKPANATVTRKRKEETIQKENLVILRRIQDVKASKNITSGATRTNVSSSTPSVKSQDYHYSMRHHHYHHKPHHHHSSHHHHHSAGHHHHHHQPADAVRSCSVSARQVTEVFSPPLHHSPKETAL